MTIFSFGAARKIAASLCLALALPAAPAFADVVVDQSSLTMPSGQFTSVIAGRIGDNVGPPIFNLSFYQTVTAGVGGYLDFVELQVGRGAGSGILAVNLYDGDFASGNASLVAGIGVDAASLAPLSQAFNQTAMLSFDVRDLDYLLTPGQVFTIGLEFIPFQPNSYALGVVGRATPPGPNPPIFDYIVYDGGALTPYVNGNPVTTGPLANRDFGFRTWVDEAVVSVVPEPASWAMMILGFGAVGTAVRTRRRVLAAA